MRITSVELRNYRVFRDLALELPPGLVGVYGANGTGKSSFLESIMWALYGRARTGKGEIRSAGESGECVAQLGFEHEENHYVVRRSISGKNFTVKARVSIGDNVVADGATDVAKYLQSVLGLDELAFRSSVFAEQKQLAAFSDQSPEQRRKLVLQLLGITPIEKARDAARADFNARSREHASLQAILGTLTISEDKVKAAESLLVELTAKLLDAEANEQAVSTALANAESALAELAVKVTESERIRALGGAARKRRDELAKLVEALEKEVAGLDAAQLELDQLPSLDEASLASLRERLEALSAWSKAVAALDSLPDAEPTPEIDEVGLVRARENKDLLAVEQARLSALVESARVRQRTALDTAARHEELTANDLCPLCGQQLAAGFDEIRKHSQVEAKAAKKELADFEGELRSFVAHLKQASAELAAAEKLVQRQRVEAAETAKRAQRRADAESRVAELAKLVPGKPKKSDVEQLRSQLLETERLQTTATTLRERVARRVDVASQLQASNNAFIEAELERESLLSALRDLGFDPKVHSDRAQHVEHAKQELEVARRVTNSARIELARVEQQLVSAKEALAEAEQKQQALAELEVDARYLGRTASLLSGFRQAVVGMIGPQLSAHASALFNDFTAGEYDGLRIDDESYAIQVIDAGVAYDSERFSGSEVDLANLSLRVAISEQIRFQAGGQIGLLVLDEALASLDSDRRSRMLGALLQLGARFRQILVVTHSTEVKESLPEAIEIVRTGQRQSTARLVDPRSF